MSDQSHATGGVSKIVVGAELLGAVIGGSLILWLTNRYEGNETVPMLAVAALAAGSFILVGRFLSHIRQVDWSVSMPEAKLPSISMPSVSLPSIDLPDFEMPKAKAVTPQAADDLTKLSGVGNKVQDVLVSAGYKSFADIAAATPEELQAVLDSAKEQYREDEAKTWPEEARLTLKAKWSELGSLQNSKKSEE